MKEIRAQYNSRGMNAYVIGWVYHKPGMGKPELPPANRAVSLYVAVEGDYYVTQSFDHALKLNDLGDAYRHMSAARNLQQREEFSAEPNNYYLGIYKVVDLVVEQIDFSDTLAEAVQQVKKHLRSDQVRALREYLAAGGEI